MSKKLFGSMKKNKKGFSLIELVVSLGIFALLTGLVVVKYGTFNQSVLLTNLAYDIALTIRTAQTYGLSVRNPDAVSPSFNYAYGVNFKIASNKQFTFFVDRNDNNIYDLGEAISPSPYSLKKGATISKLCVNSTSCVTSESELNITFKRPEPKSIICTQFSCAGSSYEDGTIIILGTDGTTRSVVVKKNGQISVLN